MSFNAEQHLTSIKGKQYLEVKWRLVWFREDYPADSGWGILTEPETVTDDAARYRASIVDPDGRTVATATKTETKAGFGDFVEKAETGAIGRALALLGYGTQFCADELAEGTRIVDSPVEPPPAGRAQRLNVTPVAKLRRRMTDELGIPEDQHQTVLDELAGKPVDMSTFSAAVCEKAWVKLVATRKADAPDATQNQPPSETAAPPAGRAQRLNVTPVTKLRQRMTDELNIPAEQHQATLDELAGKPVDMAKLSTSACEKAWAKLAATHNPTEPDAPMPMTSHVYTQDQPPTPQQLQALWDEMGGLDDGRKAAIADKAGFGVDMARTPDACWLLYEATMDMMQYDETGKPIWRSE